MSRTITVGQRNQAAAGSFAHHWTFEITDPDGNWRDVSTGLNGVDWLQSVTTSENIDNNTMTMSANFLRETVTPTVRSLAPLMTGSVVNRNAASSYAPMVDLVRQWRAKLAIVAKGTTPISTDYKPMGAGYIDTVNTGGLSPFMTISGRDLGARLLDTYISVKRPYGGVSGQSMEVVIQALLDDNLGAGAVTLYTPVSPLFTIKPYTQQFGSLLEAINTVAQQAGMVCRYRYDASDVFRLTLYKVNRTASTPDWILGPGEYLDIPQNTLDITGVRNYVELNYIDSTTGQMQTVHSPASLPSASTLAYGVRFMALDLAATTQITNSTAAQAMADAVCSDTQFPALQQQFESYGLWFVQLGDYGRFSANGLQYDSDQYGGVTNIQHTWANGVCRTVIDVRGQPAGRYKTWLYLGGAGGSGQLAVTSTPGPTSYSIAWSGDGVTLSIDGGTFTTPTASPIIVARSAAGGANHTYTFRGIRNGEIVQTEVQVPAIGASGVYTPSTILTPSLTTNQNDSTVSPVTITCKATNLPATYTYNIYAGYAHGYYSASPSFSGSNSSNPLSGGGFTFPIVPSLSEDQWFKIIVTAAGEQYSDEVEVQARMTMIDASGILTSGVDYNATIAGLAADQLAVQSGKFINESFDTPLSAIPTRYALTTFSSVNAYATGVAKVGTNVLSTTKQTWFRGATPVPFNPTKLYRLRARYRVLTNPTSATVSIYLGLQCWVNASTYVTSTYNASYVLASNEAHVVADGWIEKTSWVRGNTLPINTPGVPSTDPRSPSPLVVGTTMVSPFFILNYPNTAGPADSTMQLDYFQVDELDEDAFDRAYTAIASGGAIYRANPFDDAGTAARAVNPSGFQLYASVIDSRSALINGLFRTSIDTMDNMLDGATYERTLGTYLNVGRIVQIYRLTGGHTIDGEVLGQSIGVTPGNLVNNGSGQIGALGSQASGWTRVAGVNLVSSQTSPKIGDRCLAMSHSTANRSYSSQTISLKANAAYKFEAWIKYVGTETLTTDGVYAQLSVPGTVVVTDTSAQWLAAASSSSGFAIGVSFNPGNDGAWRYITATLKTVGGGAATLYAIFGNASGNRTGIAYFDGMTLTEQPENVTTGGYQGSVGLNGNGALIGGLFGDQNSSGALYFLVTDGPAIGTTGSPDTLPKTVTVSPSTFAYTDNVPSIITTWSVDGELQCTSVSGGASNLSFVGSLVLPNDIVATKVTVRVKKGAAGDVCSASVYSSDDSTTYYHGIYTLASTGAYVTGTIVLTGFSTLGRVLAVYFQMKPTAGSTVYVRNFKVEYEIDNLYQGV